MAFRLKRRTVKGFGWMPDIPDHRDLYYSPSVKKLPVKVSLRNCKQNPPIWDQGELGSCTAFGIGRCVEFVLAKQGNDFTPSRLFIYYMERDIEHTIMEDSGAMIRDGIKACIKYGAPHEEQWPYDIDRFTEKPSPEAYQDAELHQILEYRRVPRVLYTMKSVLACGLPFTFGFTVYENFEDIGRDGIMQMPKGSILGGHCVTAVGYDDANNRFECANSWNTDWGDEGYFYMPYAYLLDSNLSDDYWVIKKIEA